MTNRSSDQEHKTARFNRADDVAAILRIEMLATQHSDNVFKKLLELPPSGDKLEAGGAYEDPYVEVLASKSNTRLEIFAARH